MNAREKFTQSQYKSAHEKWCASPEGEAATDYAMLAFVEELPAEKSPLSTVDVHSLLLGARLYKETLLTLHKPAVKPKGGGILGPPLKPPS